MRPQYLIRFDDICPTMNWAVWRKVEAFLAGLAVDPILAVVPDNQDESLKVEQRNERFWDEVRGWQARGWTIGLHGYQHRYVSRNGGLMGINEASEFSGLPYGEQEAKLRMASDIFKRENVRPDLWIAPSHSFDQCTLKSLRSIGIGCLSDGFSLYPYQDSNEMLWVPQQLWHFRRLPLGVWTVCFHLNHWTDQDVTRFEADVQKFKPEITNFPSVVSRYKGRRSTVGDWLFARGYGTALKTREWLRTRSNNGSHAW
jgi:predicted deacetylase